MKAGSCIGVVCCLLRAGGDWRCLAKEFSLSEQAVKKINELYKERSEQVIQRWERENGCKMSVNLLMDALGRMNEHHPALKLLERFMGECGVCACGCCD